MILSTKQNTVEGLPIHVITEKKFCLSVIDIEQTNRLFTGNPQLLNNWLSQEEKEKLNQFKLPKRYREWLSGRIAIKIALEQTGKSNFTPDHYSIVTHNHGDPHLKPPVDDLQISISHSYQFCAGLVATQNCGVDIQKIEQKICNLKHKFATRQEINIVKENINSEEKLLTLIWTVKESIKKQWLPTSPSLFQDTTITGLQENSGEWKVECAVKINKNSAKTIKQQVIAINFNGYILARANKT